MTSLFDNLPHNGTATSQAAAAAKESRGTADSDRNRIMVYLYQWPDGAGANYFRIDSTVASTDEVSQWLKYD